MVLRFGAIRAPHFPNFHRGTTFRGVRQVRLCTIRTNFGRSLRHLRAFDLPFTERTSGWIKARLRPTLAYRLNYALVANGVVTTISTVRYFIINNL